MKIARFSTQGDPRYGILDEEERELIVLTGDPMFSGYDTTGERVPLAEATLLAPVIPRSKIVGAARNYTDLAGPDGAALPPQLFLKPNTTVIGPEDVIRIPADAGRVVYEGELAVVIGRIARQVPVERAFDVVFGYTVANDVSAPDLISDGGPWGRAKGYDSFCPLGPVMETELDPSDLTITVSVDGETRGSARTSDLVRGVPELIAAVSEVFTLLPGDVILTGVAAATQGQLVDGARVSIDVEGIGTLTNPARNR